MKERPLLFTPAMAAETHAGRKTQTRRVVKRGHIYRFCPGGDLNATERRRIYAELFDPVGYSVTPEQMLECCPYGKPGDRLWVREAVFDVRAWRHVPLFAGVTADFLYKADGAFIGCHRWIPNIHMPREACRSVLEVVSRRAEPVEWIRTEDAIAEGFDNNTHFLNTFYKINKRAPEGSNPWVWVVEFKKLSANAGAAAPGTPASEQGGSRGGA